MVFKSNKDKGNFFENKAVNFLEENLIKIISRNYYSIYGEIDIIGKKENTLIFVEVKARSSSNFIHPLEVITPRKINSFIKTCEVFLLKNEVYKNYNCRCDLVYFIKNDIYWEKDII